MEDVKILYEDIDVIVVVKPAGMASQGDRTMDMDMVSWLKNYLVREKKVKKEPYVGVVHRLDRPVGGVMVYAKTPQAAKSLSEQIQKGQMQKEYLAVLTGNPKQKEAKLTDYLVYDKKTNQTLVVEKEQTEKKKIAEVGGEKAKEAILHYKVIRTKYQAGKQYALVQIQLLTGRHHQIRVQMAHAGTGLWGDLKYNPVFVGQSGWHELALFARKLSFVHPRNRKKISFEAEVNTAITAHFDVK